MVVAGRSLIVIWGDVGEGNCNGNYDQEPIY